jgi:ribonuclease P protein component
MDFFCFEKPKKFCILKDFSMKYIRLKKQTDFQKLFQKGKRAHAPSLTIVYRPAEKMTMGISIGKKHGKSVVRNRVKRLLREAFRLTQGEMQGKYSIVLIPKVSQQYAFDTFQRHLVWIIKKENL